MTIEPYAKPYYIRLHQKMWDWIADGITKGQLDISDEQDAWEAKGYFLHEEEGLTRTFMNECPACAYACEDVPGSRDFCMYCPLVWPSSSTTFPCIYTDDTETEDGLYFRFCTETDRTKQAALARQIRDLPVR